MDRDGLSKLGVVALLVAAIGSVVWFSRPAAPSGKTVVRFLTNEVGSEQMAMTRAIEAAFEKQNPDVDVQIEFNALARDKMYVEIASGTAPDTFFILTYDIARLSRSNALEPLDTYFAKEPSAFAAYFPKVAETVKFDAGDGMKTYAAPIHASTDGLFYNKTAFDEAGVPYPTDDWTWDDMVAAAKRLTKRDVRGRVSQFGMAMPDPITVMLSNGGYIFSPDLTHCGITLPQSVEALQAVRDLRFKHRVAPNPAEMLETSAMQMFLRGQAAMLPGRTFMTVDCNRAKDFEYDVAATPGMKTRAERLAVGAIAMSRQISPKQKEAAWRWIRFHTTQAGGAQIVAKNKNAVTAVRSLAYSPEHFLQPPPKNIKVFVEGVERGKITIPSINGASAYMTRISANLLPDILATQDEQRFNALLERFNKEVNELLAGEPDYGRRVKAKAQ